MFISFHLFSSSILGLVQEPTSASASPTSPLRPPSPASPTSPTTPRSPSRVKCSPELPVISVEVWMWTCEISQFVDCIVITWIDHGICFKGLPGPLVLTWQEFRRTLKRLYGSVHAGWVKYLDVTEVACSVDNKKSQSGLKNHPKNRRTTYKPINQKDRDAIA